MAEIPKILLLFANPKGDLSNIKKELNDIVASLRYAKAKKICDFDTPFENEAFSTIVDYTSGIEEYSASIFHFSGHANEQSLLLTEDASSVKAVCDLLKKIGTKMAFLNGCCTKGFISNLFKDTDVTVAIATYNKVQDPVAAQLADMFYKQFTRGNNMETIFRNMRSSFEKHVLHREGFDMRDLQLPAAAFPDENKAAFQWGLFYKNPNYSNITVDNLMTKGPGDIAKINQKIKDVTKKLVAAQEELTDLEADLRRSPSEPRRRSVTSKKMEINSFVLSITELEQERDRMNRERNVQETRAIKAKLSDEFRKAIKNINYFDQQEVYEEGTQCQFACYAAVGDEDALIDLLLMRLEDQYDFNDNNHLSLVIEYKSILAQKFWPALAYELKLEPGEKPDSICKTLVNDYFLGTVGYTQQHIFLKIYISQLRPDDVAKLVFEFWDNLQKVCNQSAVLTGSTEYCHRIVVILIDQMGSQDRLAAIEAITNNINAQLQTKFKPMPWVKPLQQQEIQTWIDIHALSRVGIRRTMAGEIFTESGNGKIRKILESVQKKCTMPDLDLFYQLNILPDHAQTVFGKE